MSTTDRQPETPDTQYELRDRQGNLARGLFPLPGLPSNAPTFVKNLCSLPPAELASRIPGDLVGKYSPCPPSRGTSALFGCIQWPSASRNPNQTEPTIDPQCIWSALTQDPSSELSRPAWSDTGFCIPIDSLPNDIVPVPTFNKLPEDMIPTPMAQDVLLLPALKYLLESRNATAARTLPLFANMTVRPLHQRLRLGICAPLPTIGSPCSLAAVDAQSGALAKGWHVDAATEYSKQEFDFALARPAAQFAALVGPRIDNVYDPATKFTDAIEAAPPMPVVAGRWHPNLGASRTQWTIPLVTCVPANSSSSSSSMLGTMQALKVNGTCSSARECLSGACGLNGQCDNSIKPETNSSFTAAFTSPSPLGTMYPPDVTLVNQALPFQRFGANFEAAPNEAGYYWPIMVIGGVVVLLLLVAAGHRRLPLAVRRRLGLVRDGDGIELKPVSGNMVSDVGEERVVTMEGGEVGGERLPRYCAPEEASRQ